MGRKIPAKKHRGVKDPLEQQARRLQSVKGKINAPPKDPDEQPIPHSLTRLFAFQHKDKTIKKKKKKTARSTGGTRESDAKDNPIARLKKLPGESGRGFSLRINSAVRALHDPLEQQAYAEDVELEDAKGSRMSAQRERRRKRAGVPQRAEPRAQRRARLQLARKAKAAEEAQWAERAAPAHELVPFGAVAHAPPALAAPRHARASARPARRGLLLAPLLAPGACGAGGAAARRDADSERARLDAVAAYRALKKERRLQENTKRKQKSSNN